MSFTIAAKVRWNLPRFARLICVRPFPSSPKPPCLAGRHLSPVALTRDGLFLLSGKVLSSPVLGIQAYVVPKLCRYLRDWPRGIIEASRRHLSRRGGPLCERRAYNFARVLRRCQTRGSTARSMNCQSQSGPSRPSAGRPNPLLGYMNDGVVVIRPTLVDFPKLLPGSGLG